MHPITRILIGPGLAALLSAGTLACDGEGNPVDPGPGNGGNGNAVAAAVLTGQITDDRGLSADTTYLIRGFLEVLPGGSLTVPAGTRLVSEIATDGSIVTVAGEAGQPSGRFVVQGTAAAPVLFLPGNEATVMAGQIPDPSDSCARNSAGGIVLHGSAPINQPAATSEGINRAFGGNDPADDSGDIQYLVIICSGTEIAPDNEINGLTFAGTGSGTRVSHVQVHLGGDDGFEWFGGTTNADHLVVSGTDDDGFDCDFGWTGTVQFGLVVQDADVANRGVECDNDGDGSSLTPITDPSFWNVTWIGAGVEVANSEINDGLYLRRNSEPDFFNSILMNFGNAGVAIDGSGSQANAAGGALDLDHLLFFNNQLLAIGAPAEASCLTDNVFFEVDDAYVSDGVEAAFGDGTFVCADPMLASVDLADPISGTKPDPRPRSGSPALDPANAATPNGPGIVDPSADYLGAFDDGDDWTAGWSVWVDAQ